MKECIFCQIEKGERKADIVYEDESVVAFKDLHPIAPVHILIVPREHIPTVDDFEERHEKLAGHMILAAQKIARELGISKDGYKLLFRVKSHGGQEVDHLHLHLLGGAPLSEDIKPI